MNCNNGVVSTSLTRTGMLAGILSLMIASAAFAGEINVSPGAGAFAAGLAKAKAGDTVKVGAGEYRESVSIPQGVVVEGAGADTTTIIATEYAALNCAGRDVQISGLTVKGEGKNMRGVNSSTPVRVVRCRFEKVQEAVALMEAPLSDVIACEFIDCGIGVRAIGGACPTVWGCMFKGGNMGIFNMDGGPYVRNNVFDGVKTGIRIMPDTTQPGIFRNNVFNACEIGMNPIAGKSAFFGPSIRNSVFSGCGVALSAPTVFTSGFSDAIIADAKGPIARDPDGKEIPIEGRRVGPAAIKISIAKDLTVSSDHPELLEGHGVRLCAEPASKTGTIGLEKAWARVGVGATAELPPVRFAGKMLIANSVHEEHQYLKVIKRGSSKQSLSKEGEVRVDRLTLGGAGEPKELVFDISRFFGEESIK